ncbi:uncharacterized protein LOC115450875 isoform X2 [Manduca sexta]|uniref:uncharacterized protein LOC115450875 isoform X2 n=1 Tax=Manduca sexta TaxID=7130 RepID=UPI0018908CC1|nr:uncharacterized protein LOC115450875 isoform X2 [Manduca sexta]
MRLVVFSSLENYQVNAVPASETQYPWIARVVHSSTNDLPHVCTAVCIEKRIFITAARCIYSLKVSYTTVIYMDQRLPVLAFVVPSDGTKQAFDDIGFIVVEAGYIGPWPVIQLFNAVNRTDNDFQWFANMDANGIEYRVVGYATEKGIHRIKSSDRQFNLTDLDIYCDIDLCSNIMTFFGHIQGFRVPCYHSCTLLEFKSNDEKCKSYHGVEGGAVIDLKTNKLVGVATWGAYFRKYELPVGYSVVNSDNFFKDYKCAKHIRDDSGLLVTTGYYQGLCDAQ